jgi:hypothetical protein
MVRALTSNSKIRVVGRVSSSSVTLPHKGCVWFERERNREERKTWKLINEFGLIVVLLFHIELEFYFWSRLFENLSKVQTIRMCLPVGFWRVLKRRAHNPPKINW